MNRREGEDRPLTLLLSPGGGEEIAALLLVQGCNARRRLGDFAPRVQRGFASDMRMQITAFAEASFVVRGESSRLKVNQAKSR